ncbi:MAG: CinA family protein [Gammaproteobacteria bacterium]|nr:CinA family protein [Gammaproteobacteria bacterium]
MAIEKEVIQLSNQLIKRRLLICTAESCTGGLIAKSFTDVVGSSKWFESGFVTYSNNAKHKMLGLDKQLIESSGAVSQSVAVAMAEGAITNSLAKISIATTGIAGPAGGTKEKPVGMVWIAWAAKHYTTQSQCFFFDGDRESVRNQAAIAAISGCVKFIVKNA